MLFTSRNEKQRTSFLSRRTLVAPLVLFGMVSVAAHAATELEPVQQATQFSSASAVTSKFRAAPAGRAIAGEYIVVLKSDFVQQKASLMASQQGLSFSATSNSAENLNFRAQAVTSMSDEMAGAYGASVAQKYHAAISGFVTKMDRRAMRYMLADSRIDYIEENQMMYANDVQTNAPWGLDRIDQPNLPLNSQYVFDLDGSGVKAFILDTGILASHSNFGGRVASGFTAINDGRGSSDCNGHGTHVAGTVGATTYGVAKNVTLIPVRVLSCSGSGSNAGVIAGVDWVAQNASGASVANMSLGGGNSSALDSAVNNAIDAGVTFVVAAGNSNANACSGSPNRVPRALTVASSTSSDSRSSFSNWGSCVDLFAPGSNIQSTWSNGGTRTISGTSMASPHVAGVAALYLQANPSASPSQVESAIESAAVSGRISSTNGSPNLLVQSNFGGTPTPTSTPTPTPTTPPGGPEPIDASATNVSVTQGSWVRYTLTLGSGYSNVTFSISGGSGDADLYVNYGSQSSLTNYDCRPYRNGNNESCSFNNPAAGVWHVDIRGYTSASGVTVRAVAN